MRQLESMIRLSEAMARLHCSDIVCSLSVVCCVTMSQGVHRILLRFKVWQILSKIWNLKRDLSI